MVQEDQNQVCSNNSGNDEGGIVTRSSSKKSKQKKVPQRGLGVAQLEKIRMEEQQKNKDGNNSSSQDATHHHFPHSNNQKPSKSCFSCTSPSPPPMPPMNQTPQNSIFRAHSLPNTENFHLDSIPSLNPINNNNNGDGFQVRWPSNPVHGNNVSFPKMRHHHPSPHDFCGDHNKGDNSIFPPALSFPYDTSNVAPLPDVQPRSTPLFQPPISNSLVNVSSMNLSSSSVLSFPMEPPSNQSFYGTYSSLLWPDDDQMMAGVKRSCPFPSENPPIPKFHSKYAPVVNHPISRSDESTSGGNGGTTYNFDSSNPIFRDMPSCPSAFSEPANSRKTSKSENGNSHTQEFLSLAPPVVASSNPNSRLKHFCKLDSSLYQVSVEDPPMDSTRREGSSQKSNMLNFFPPNKLQATTSTPTPTPANHHESCNSDVGESIDLKLKL